MPGTVFEAHENRIVGKKYLAKLSESYDNVLVWITQLEGTQMSTALLHLRLWTMRKLLVKEMWKTSLNLIYHADITVKFHTFFLCSTSSDTLVTISSSDSPVREPCLLCLTSLINPVSSNLKRESPLTQRCCGTKYHVHNAKRISIGPL